MSLGYRAVGWNRQKKVYDRTLLAAVVAYLALYVGVGFAVHPDATAETMLIRAFGTAALVLLHVILCIGPLARLDRRFLPLLYNRRHLGVTMFCLAFAHGASSLIQFHALGDLNPLVSLLSANPRIDSVAHFPFQPLGAAALAILFAMAATSHDFWLANLSAPVWKALHMLVYVAYGLIVLHVALGVVQAEVNPTLSVLLALGMVTVLLLHVVAGLRETGGDDDGDVVSLEGEADSWVEVGPVGSIPEGRAVTAVVAGDRVAVFRHDGKVSALSNACQHQNGPLGEGRIVDGFVTCPWHGYQYRPECGRSPEPFTEKVPTFDVRVRDGVVFVGAKPHPAGTAVEPAACGGGEA